MVFDHVMGRCVGGCGGHRLHRHTRASGHKVDKSQLFETFYGKLENAPMIQECPLNLECRVRQILPLNASELFTGETLAPAAWAGVVAAYTEEQYLSNDEPDIRKINPLIFSMPDNNYWKVGEHLGQARARASAKN